MQAPEGQFTTESKYHARLRQGTHLLCRHRQARASIHSRRPGASHGLHHQGRTRRRSTVKTHLYPGLPHHPPGPRRLRTHRPGILRSALPDLQHPAATRRNGCVAPASSRTAAPSRCRHPRHPHRLPHRGQIRCNHLRLPLPPGRPGRLRTHRQDVTLHRKHLTGSAEEYG